MGLSRVLVAGAFCAAVVFLPSSVRAGGTSANPVLTGSVGPGYTISLKDPDGNELSGKTLSEGTYTVEIDDLSTAHNFHLFGPGVSCPVGQCQTSVPGTGHETWTVTFRPGAATYQCDPHETFGLRGDFKVRDPTAPPPPPPPPAPPAAPPPPQKRAARCHVPNVVGRRLTAARRLIRRGRCSVGRVRYARSATRRGRVLRQSPRAGTRLRVGGRVNLLVGS